MNNRFIHAIAGICLRIYMKLRTYRYVYSHTHIQYLGIFCTCIYKLVYSSLTREGGWNCEKTSFENISAWGQNYACTADAIFFGRAHSLTKPSIYEYSDSRWTCICMHIYIYIHIHSDTQLIDHLVMREFVSRPPIYCSIHKRGCDRKTSFRESSWAVCGFRAKFFKKRRFLGSSFLIKLKVFEEHSPFCWH